MEGIDEALKLVEQYAEKPAPQMRVFKVNDCDWVCAENKQQAKDWYKKEFLNEDDEFDEIEEANIDIDELWFSIEAYDLKEYLRKYGKKIVHFDRSGDCDFVVKITFREMIERDKPTCPYVICSTEY